MTQDELKAHIVALNAQVADAFATLTQVAKETKFLEANTRAGAEAILAILAAPAEEPVVVGEIVAGAPVEQKGA